jgi:hypothetical protein
VASAATLSLSSYTFVPPCSLDPVQLCQTILTILPPLFLGDTAHEALMQRSCEILKYLCHYNSFDKNLLSMLWEIGCTHKNASVLQVLQELIPNSFNFESLEFLASQIQSISPPLVTLQIADMLGAIALRCRSILLEIPQDHPQVPTLSTIHYSHDAIEASPPASPQVSQSFRGNQQSLHELCLSTLFVWAEDGSNVNDAVAIRCVTKIESIFDLGFTTSLAIQAGSTFPWAAHWKRCYQTILRAIHCLQMNQSISLSIKTIRSFFLSWIKEEEFLKANVVLSHCGGDNGGEGEGGETCLSVHSFYRHAISQHFEESYQLMKLVTSAILSLKTKFNEIAYGIIQESKQDHLSHTAATASATAGAIATAGAMSNTNAYELSSELQSVLNGIMIDKSRIGFKDQLEALFDFTQFLVRSSPSIRFNFSSVQLIWNHVLLAAITPQERDLVFSFLNRLIVNRSPSTPHNSSMTTESSKSFSGSTEQKSVDQGTDSGFLETKEQEPTSSSSVLPSENIQPMQMYGRLSFCEEGDVSLIYSELLCHQEFITSAHFSTLALLCLEKYYKWISANNGSLVELPGKDGGFIILKSLSIQTEWKIFPKIVMYCQEDKVALDAVKFLTGFPQRLSQSLVYDGDVVSLRQSILSQGMAELEDIRNHALGSDSITTDPHLTRKLKRTLMLLNSLLDESSADSSKRIKSHSGKWKNKQITLKIQYSKLGNGHTTVTLETSDTLDDLLNQIAKTLSKDIQQLKFFRRGSELTRNNLIRRTLLQMDLLMNETIVVVDRPVNSAPTYSFSKPYICPLESLPGVILSSKPEYLEVLFSLIDITSGSICNDIWELIIRLPTSPQAWNTWKSMVTVNSIYSDSDSTNSNLNLFTLNSDSNSDSLGKRVKIPRSLSRLIYNLQIIENFLHATVPVPVSTKESSSSSVVEDLDDGIVTATEEDDELWIGMFIAFGGIKALEDAFVYIIQQCSLYCSQDTEKEKSAGLTSQLIHCALILITKIIRSIMIRGVVCAKPICFEQITTLLKSVSNSISRETNSNSNSDKDQTNRGQVKAQLPSVGTAGPGAPVEEEEEGGEELLLEKRLNSIEEREELLSHEWGNKFNAHFDVANASSAELLESTINLSQIQSAVFHFLILLPKFCHEAVFTPHTHQSFSLLSVRELLQNNQNDFLLCVENIFIIWGSALLLDPTLAHAMNGSELREDEAMELETSLETSRVTADHDHVSIQNLLSTILTQFPSSHSVTTIHSESLARFPALVGSSAMTGLLTILTLIEDCFPEEVETRLNLRSNFLSTVFVLRPQVSRSLAIAPATPGGAPAGAAPADSENLFLFASKLLQDDNHHPHPHPNLQLDEQQVLEICNKIFEEFTSPDLCGDPQQESCCSCSGKYQQIPILHYFSGNMRLLYSLLRRSSTAMNLLLEKGIVNFLIHVCLGIRPPDSITLNILCNDSDTRLFSAFLSALLSLSLSLLL